MANTLNPVSGATPPGGATTGATPSAPEKLVNPNLFLQLMVAQLRNQNPLNPVDGADFLAQLSQVSGVEQLVQVNQQATKMNEQLAAIRDALVPAV